MKDFPVFTTEHGAASLILKEIPYRKEAYIILRDTQEPEAMTEDCRGFCRVCGAKKIYASGHEWLEAFPLQNVMLEMRGTVEIDREQVENLWPVTEATVTKWREIYNRRMAGIDNAATLEARDEEQIVKSGGAYFIHHNGELLGIGWLEESQITAIAATVPGMGETVLNTLLSVNPGETYTLQVASTNEKALRLYEKMGFIRVREISRWYEIPIDTVSRKNA